MSYPQDFGPMVPTAWLSALLNTAGSVPWTNATQVQIRFRPRLRSRTRLNLAVAR